MSRAGFRSWMGCSGPWLVSVRDCFSRERAGGCPNPTCLKQMAGQTAAKNAAQGISLLTAVVCGGASLHASGIESAECSRRAAGHRSRDLALCEEESWSPISGPERRFCSGYRVNKRLASSDLQESSELKPPLTRLTGRRMASGWRMTIQPVAIQFASGELETMVERVEQRELANESPRQRVAGTRRQLRSDRDVSI